MALAIIYARQSDVNKKNKTDEDKEETLSLETQIAACRERAAKNGDTVVAVYSEQYTGTVGLGDATTGEIGRPRYTEMVNDIKANIKKHPEGHPDRITKIYVYKYLRLSREPNETVPLVAFFRIRGVEVEPVTENKISADPMGEMQLYMIMTFGKMQVSESIKHAKDARKTLEDKGLIVGAGRCRFGYQYDKKTKTRVIDEAKSPIVRRIFEELASGKATNAVMMGLRADNITTPSGRSTKWTPATIYQIVKDKSYYGHAFQAGKVKPLEGRYKGGQKRVKVSHVGDRTVGDSTPAIVSREIWDAANATVSSRQVSHTKHTHWLIGRVFCRKCGANLCRVKHHSGEWYWRCPKYTADRSCIVSFLLNKKLEPVVVAKVWSFLMDPEVREARLKQLMEKVVDPMWAVELGRNQEEAAKIRKQIGSIMTRWSEDPEMAEIAEEQIKKLRADLKTRQDLVATLAARVEQGKRGLESVDAAKAILDKIALKVSTTLEVQIRQGEEGAWEAVVDRSRFVAVTEAAGVEVFAALDDDTKRWVANSIGLAVFVTQEGKGRTHTSYGIDVESFRFADFKPTDILFSSGDGVSGIQSARRLVASHTTGVLNKSSLHPILL